MANFGSWLEERVQGDYSDKNLQNLHSTVKAAHGKAKGQKQQDLAILEQALATVAKDRLYFSGTPLDDIDPSSLV